MFGGNYKARSTDNLSAHAQRLVELVFDKKQSLSQVLKDDPDLMDGLDEYHKWHGENYAAIAETRKTPSTGHSVKKILKNLKKK